MPQKDEITIQNNDEEYRSIFDDNADQDPITELLMILL